MSMVTSSPRRSAVGANYTIFVSPAACRPKRQQLRLRRQAHQRRHPYPNTDEDTDRHPNSADEYTNRNTHPYANEDRDTDEHADADTNGYFDSDIDQHTNQHTDGHTDSAWAGGGHGLY